MNNNTDSLFHTLHVEYIMYIHVHVHVCGNTVSWEILEGIKFGEFGVLIAIRQNKIHHFEPLYACSMAHATIKIRQSP